MQTKRDAVTFSPFLIAGCMRATETTQNLSRLQKMSNRNTQIYNVTTKGHVKLNQAEKAVAYGLCKWVDETDQSKGIRKLTLAEMVAIRATMAHAEATRHLQGAEVAGLRYKRPESSTWQQAHLDAQNKFNGCLKAAREFSDCQCSWCSALAHRLAIREAALSCN